MKKQMKKQILSEEIKRMQQLAGIIKENDEYYDKILDFYNEVGIEGLSNDEVEYLKSGGQTELPNRFKSKISQEKYDNFVKGIEPTDLTASDWQDIIALQNIIDNVKKQVYVVNNYDNVGFYLNVLCSLVFPMDETIVEELKKLNNYSNMSKVVDNEYYYVIPKYYLEHLSGI